jgi:hypothetical protein
MSDEPRTRDTVGRLIVGMVIVFLVTLAIVIGRRMSAEALAVVVGVVCGVAAAVPTLLILAYVLSRTNAMTRDLPTQRRERDERRQLDYPPVVVVQPPYQPASTSGYWPSPRTPALLDEGTSQEPNIRVVGEDD